MKYLLFVSILLLGTSWAVAQSDSSQPTSPQTSSGQTATSSGGETTVQGCLSGSSGNYTLTDKGGQTYQLTGDTSKLSEHVGHEVKVTGTTQSASATSGSSATTASANGQSLQVSSVKHISKTCESGGMSH